MEPCLVMKNSLRRRFSRPMTYFLFVLLPFVVIFISTCYHDLRSKQGIIGIKTEQTLDSILERYQLEQGDDVRFVAVKPMEEHTDAILKRFDVLVIAKEGQLSREQLQEIAMLSESARSADTQRTDSTKNPLSFLLMIEMMSASIYGVTFIKDRRDGVLSRCISCGVKQSSYQLGIGGSVLVIIGLQTAVTLLALLLFDGNFCFDWIRVLLFWGYITFISTVFGMLIAIVNTKEMNANLVASAMVVVFSLLGGSLVAVEEMPRVLQWFSYISPVRWLMLL